MRYWTPTICQAPQQVNDYENTRECRWLITALSKAASNAVKKAFRLNIKTVPKQNAFHEHSQTCKKL